MSTYYSFGIAIGFEFAPEELADVFGEQVPEKSHMEDRFDQKTGKKTGRVKVVDQEAQIVCKLDGKVYESDDWSNFADNLAGKIKCRSNLSVDSCTGEGTVVFGPRMPNCLSHGDDFHSIDLEGPMPMGPILKLGPELKRISKALRKLGLKPGPALVRISYAEAIKVAMANGESVAAVLEGVRLWLITAAKAAATKKKSRRL